ncbi:Uncharacterised protein [Mycolicibacterium vanbaalenii]|uniref:Uncharacterized protein n=1 Tax=Mycolicibacterium vanbaalenii TaxID=110539 RepID=A0A5S9R5L3_MYCVN|nr:hypothetical protein [Mycolicibacterium vanbaalenii]CAA0129291.1 Uncharacterised protein [Mycolicibacterium vanbaalenii]
MSFTAAYHGACGYGDRIEPGDQVVYEDGELVHVGCANIDVAETPCRDCNLVHAGRCF